MRACILCGQTGPFPALYARGGHTLVRCPRCRLVFLDPQPDPAALERAYYHDAAFSQALVGELRGTTLERAREKLAFLGGVARPGLRVLDVGASSGAWLEVAAAAGMTGVGIELGAATAASARERGLDVRTGTLQLIAPELPATGFDLITFWDVLEHLPDPRTELALARDLLAPGGAVAATFPNVDGLYPRLTRRLLTPLTGAWEHPELPVHFYDLSPMTARRLFAGQGLTVASVTTYATPYTHFQETSLAPGVTGHGRRGKAVRAAFDLLHRAAYPVARRTDRGNAMAVLAHRG